MNQEHKYIYIYNTILILICGFILYILLRPVNNNSKSQNTRQQTINYPTKTNQAITSLDTMGNLSALSFPTGFILILYPPDTKILLWLLWLIQCRLDGLFGMEPREPRTCAVDWLYRYWK